jgi:dipeptidyl aminopeptidase/acylaminoacyl peptidase
MKILKILSLVVLLTLAVSAQDVWTPEMQVKTKIPGAVQISPDGKRVVYTVSEAVMTADKSEFISQIWLGNTDGSNAFQITFGDKSSTNPKWSPDGTSIAFTSNRKDNRNNLYLLRVQGGEAEPLTDLKGSVSDFNWSPDGSSIAYAMTDAKTDDEEKNDKGRNDFRWVDENQKMSRLYIMPVAKDTNGKRDARKLTTENYNVSGFDWSPDGRTIAFAYTKTAGANDWTTSDVSLIDVTNSKITVLANTSAAENSPRFSPDGKSIALTVSDNPPRWAQENRINIVAATGGTPKPLAASFDGQPVMADWSADGKMIYFTEAKGVKTGLYSIEINSGKTTEFSKTVGIFSVTMNAARNMFGMVWQNPTLPPEVYVSAVNKLAPVQISKVNADLAKMPMPRTEVIKWKSKDGRDIEGLLTYPIGYQAGQKVPMILNIHGGPTGVFQQSFIGGRGVYPLATFASKGYAILRPNPRGSSGYGTEFRRANIKDWGGADYLDLMAGVDKVVEMGVADENRLGVMGWSYGGYMTSWIVTQTKRFKAASAGAPVTNLMSFNGTADIPSFVPDYFGGQSWENPEIYAKHSAMFNIKGVTTPTMIQHGDADVRVPISQGYEFYNALKSQGVPTRMIVLPRQPHGPNEPKMQIAAMQSNLDWFDKYLGASAQK